MKFIYLLTILCTIETIHGWCGNEGCTFNGLAYRLYVPVQFGCFVFQCVKSERDFPHVGISEHVGFSWEFLHIDSRCSNCSVRVDPHFKTFDNYYYDFHGKCNYTISHPHECFSTKSSSYYPRYGIFSDFRSCVDSPTSPTCLDLTTYKISDDLSILIRHTSHPLQLEINGSPLPVSSVPVSYYDCSYFSSVIVWNKGDSIFVVGEHYSIYASNNYMIVYADPESKENVAGLCGFYSGDFEDDFRLRDCSYESLSNEVSFGENWRTIDQSDYECRKSYVDHGVQHQPKDIPCEKHTPQRICERVILKAKIRCPSGYSKEEIESVIEDCVEDCCLAGVENCQMFAEVGADYLCSLYELDKLTRTSRVN